MNMSHDSMRDSCAVLILLKHRFSDTSATLGDSASVRSRPIDLQQNHMAHACKMEYP
jgi:hypothetical protein